MMQLAVKNYALTNREKSAYPHNLDDQNKHLCIVIF